VNMIDRHIEASERLYNMMLQDHKERVSDLVEWADMNASLMRKLDERDRRIRELDAEIVAIKTMAKM